MRRLHLVDSAPSAASSVEDLRHALRVLRNHPPMTAREEALLLVEVMDARASKMQPGGLRSTLVRCVTLLSRCHGRRHLSPLP